MMDWGHGSTTAHGTAGSVAAMNARRSIVESLGSYLNIQHLTLTHLRRNDGLGAWLDHRAWNGRERGIMSPLAAMNARRSIAMIGIGSISANCWATPSRSSGGVCMPTF